MEDLLIREHSPLELDTWLYRIEQLYPKSMDLGLDRVQKVAARLLEPNFPCPVVVVGGTNGKGSCVTFLETIWRQAGYKTASYTSPHLLRYNERVCVEGHPIADDALCQAFSAVEAARLEVSLTYFEYGTLAALWHFQNSAPLDVIILEVGLGGRLDAVNIVDADVSVITSVDLDHEFWLGHTREAIALEKAGIFRNARPVVCGDPHPPQSLLDAAAHLGCPLYVRGKEFDVCAKASYWSWQGVCRTYSGLPQPKLLVSNAATALQVIELLQTRLPVSEAHLSQGLEQSELSGRFQTVMLEGGVLLIFDVAHNPASMAECAARLREFQTGRTFAVFSMLKDKNLAGALETLYPYVSFWHVAPLSVDRGYSYTELSKVLSDNKLTNCVIHSNIVQAYQSALAQARHGDRVLISGSFHTVSEVMAIAGISLEEGV